MKRSASSHSDENCQCGFALKRETERSAPLRNLLGAHVQIEFAAQQTLNGALRCLAGHHPAAARHPPIALRIHL
jgi:hypothetical protein